MNRIILLGRLVADPSIRYTPANKVVAQFTLAVDRPFANDQGKREADFIPVVMFGKQAELVGNNCSKGQRLLVDGRLQIRSFAGKDGTTKWMTEVIVSGFDFIERRGDNKQAAQPSEPASPHELPKGVDEAIGASMDELGEEVPF